MAYSSSWGMEINLNNIGCLVAKRSNIYGYLGIKKSELIVGIPRTTCVKKMKIRTKWSWNISIGIELGWLVNIGLMIGNNG